jgi:hypothetical protein
MELETKEIAPVPTVETPTQETRPEFVRVPQAETPTVDEGPLGKITKLGSEDVVLVKAADLAKMCFAIRRGQTFQLKAYAGTVAFANMLGFKGTFEEINKKVADFEVIGRG